MNAEFSFGIVLVLLGGFLTGSFALPMKHMPAWRWEHTWLIYSFSGMVVLPWVFALATVPHLYEVYSKSSWSDLIDIALFGFAWGIGSTMVGLGITRVGMALGFAIILGITGALGSFLPLAILRSDQLWTRQGYKIIAGLVVVTAGITLSSIAGGRRERELAARAPVPAQAGFGAGLAICVLAGVFSSLLNFGFVFGKNLQQLSLADGARPAMASSPIWLVILGAGFLSNAGYCVYLLQSHHGWHIFTIEQSTAKYWLGGSIMGAVWFSGIAIYGVGVAAMGSLGAIVGWPVFMVVIIMTASVWGALTGEWRGASRASYAYSCVGLVVLLSGIYVISLGGSSQ
jgi:L-rhamnose-H+ transport protein